MEDTIKHLQFNASKYLGAIPSLRWIAGRLQHPWFSGFSLCFSNIFSGSPFEKLSSSLDLSAPILFLARGHSGTTPLAKILSEAGVYIGNTDDKYCLNSTLDALYWVYGFQRTLIPKLFKVGSGCLVDEPVVRAVALECLRRHLRDYAGGPWAFKTCAGMFAHPLYRYVFPRAKYIYLIRDGRDVILSGNGFFHLTHPFSRQQHWDYFKVITFGISNDFASCSFDFPKRPRIQDGVMQNRFWIQAKSWREHVRMVEHLKKNNLLSPNVYTVRYEDLCENPVPVLEKLFTFLEVELTGSVKNFVTKVLHTQSVGRWKKYDKYISNYNENMESVYESLEPEMKLLGYLE